MRAAAEITNLFIFKLVGKVKSGNYECGLSYRRLKS
jgi:hypothetical protein